MIIGLVADVQVVGPEALAVQEGGGPCGGIIEPQAVQADVLVAQEPEQLEAVDAPNVGKSGGLPLISLGPPRQIFPASSAYRKRGASVWIAFSYFQRPYFHRPVRRFPLLIHTINTIFVILVQPFVTPDLL